MCSEIVVDISFLCDGWDRRTPEATSMRWRHRSSGNQPLTAHDPLGGSTCATICASLRSRPEFNGRVSESLSPIQILQFPTVCGAAQLLITNESSSLLNAVSCGLSSDLCGLFMEISIRVEIENLLWISNLQPLAQPGAEAKLWSES